MRAKDSGALADRRSYRVNVPTAKSEYLKLLNLFDAREETEPNWDKDLRDDVKAECEAKYGPVADIFLDRDSTVRRTDHRRLRADASAGGRDPHQV